MEILIIIRGVYNELAEKISRRRNKQSNADDD